MAKEIHLNYHGRELTMTGVCEVSGKPYQVTIPAYQYLQWKSGTVIQRAMPDLNNEQREFFVSGTTPDEWRKIFPPNKEDDEWEE